MRLGGLAQKSSEGRGGLVRRSIGFFALFWFIFWASKKEQKGGMEIQRIKFGISQ
jgi:hypothetical protein